MDTINLQNRGKKDAGEGGKEGEEKKGHAKITNLLRKVRPQKYGYPSTFNFETYKYQCQA
eukprot:scaffold17527_cov42-Cyclotella_meneghiniana.AAC.5